jgi:sulfonate transport system substrate-binding protein
MMKTAITAFIAGLALATTASAADPVKIRLGWSVAPAQIAPIMFDHPGIAKHQGKSYVMEPVRGTGSAVALNQLATGDLEIAPLTFTQLEPAIRNAGLTDLRIVADDFRDGVEGYETNLWMVHKDSPIRKVEDLKGKIVAVPSIGTGMDVFTRVMLKKHGLEATRDYTLVEVVFPNMGAVMNERKADLVIAVKPFYLNPAFGGNGRVLFTQKEAVGPTDIGSRRTSPRWSISSRTCCAPSAGSTIRPTTTRWSPSRRNSPSCSRNSSATSSPRATSGATRTRSPTWPRCSRTSTC